jgi:negative regulator of sigma E activity
MTDRIEPDSTPIPENAYPTAGQIKHFLLHADEADMEGLDEFIQAYIKCRDESLKCWRADHTGRIAEREEQIAALEHQVLGFKDRIQTLRDKLMSATMDSYKLTPDVPSLRRTDG